MLPGGERIQKRNQMQRKYFFEYLSKKYNFTQKRR
jgi:hypothetical protein